MVKDIFFEATRGKRELSNYAEGMYLMEMLVAHNTVKYIGFYYEQLVNAEIDAESALSRLVDMAWNNTMGSNGYTKTSLSILKAYNIFK